MPTTTASPEHTGDLVGSQAAAPSAGQRNVAMLLGVLTGLVGLIGMARLAGGAFSGDMSRFAWAMVLAAMLPWVAFVAWRARHGQLAVGRMLLVAGLAGVGAGCVWLSVFGPVLALVCSLAGFAVIWVSDWPARRSAGDDRFVRIEELQREDDRD